MKNIYAFIFLLFVSMLIVPVSYATPPQDMEASYDPVLQVLIVKMRHVTIELREHYIRTITVAVNEKEPQIFRYPFQKSPNEFEAVIPLVLNPGDRLVVKAQCKLGGSAEVELTIPNPDPGSEDNQTEKSSAASDQGSPQPVVNQDGQ